MAVIRCEIEFRTDARSRYIFISDANFTAPIRIFAPHVAISSIIHLRGNIAEFMMRTLIKRHANLANKFIYCHRRVGISEFTDADVLLSVRFPRNLFFPVPVLFS